MCAQAPTHARAASSPRPLGPYFESSLPPRKPSLPLEAQWLPLPTLCVTHRDSPQPGCGPDLLEVSPLQSCLKQEFPSPGMSRTSPPVGQLTRALRAQMLGSSSLLLQPRVGLGGPPRSAASPGFPDAQGGAPSRPWAATGGDGSSTALLPPRPCGGPASGPRAETRDPRQV